MKAITTRTLIALLCLSPIIGWTQNVPGKAGPPVKAEVVSFTCIPVNGKLYFKITLKDLQKDIQLVLEKEVPGKKEAVTVDTRKGIGTDESIPILYSFQEEDPKPKSTIYRIRGFRSLKNGETRVSILAEKRFPKSLLSSK